jgi:hypothetical protein
MACSEWEKEQELWYTSRTLVCTQRGGDSMERIPRVATENFAEQFTAVLYDHWSEIIHVLNRQSPRLAALLRVSSPAGIKRTREGWQIQVVIKRIAQPEKLRQPRDNEIVAHAIRSWARLAAQFDLPHVTVNFEM